MGFQEKKVSVAIRLDLPDQIPQFSADVLRRVPELAAYQQQWQKLWYDLLTSLRRLAPQSAAQSSGVPIATAESVSTLKATTEASLAGFKADLDNLITQASALLGQVSEVSAVSGQTSASLDEHVALAQSVHGVLGAVVGTFDKQNLDNKTIGRALPGYVRGRQVIWANSVAFGESVEVPADYQMVVAGPYRVNGQLIVQGRIKVI